MTTLKSWLSRVLADAATRVAATFLAGVLVASLGFIFSADVSAFLRSEVSISVTPLLVLVLLAALGTTAAIERIWNQAVAARSTPSMRPRDDRLETASMRLLEKLAAVEVGPEIYGEYPMKEFASDLLSRLDQWEVAVYGYVSEEQRKLIRATREHIQSRSLNHSREEAKEWVSTVKGLSNAARLNVR